MNYFAISEVKDLIRTNGRTYFDEKGKALYSNWTCGAFEFGFKGTALKVEFTAMKDTLMPPPGRMMPGMEIPKPDDWPFIAVFLDDGEEPYLKTEVKDGDSVLVFFRESTETHKIKIVKLTENFRTELGITGFRMDGELFAVEEDQKPIIEFIGDSITCGFGNDTRDAQHQYVASEQNGWMTHGAIAARRLGLEPRFISVSGISVTSVPGMPGPYCMEDLYPYADLVLEDKLGEKYDGKRPEVYTPYDFSQKKAKYVVLNLGTNDANQIYFSPDKEAQAQRVREHYKAFVQNIRKLNGPETMIICALGCMDYYLFDVIRDIVSEIKTETGDQNIVTLKYNKMMAMGPDAGAVGHPHIHRHKLMAEDLVKFISQL